MPAWHMCQGGSAANPGLPALGLLHWSSPLKPPTLAFVTGPWIALVGDASEACEPGGCSLTMRVFFKSRPGEQLHLVGNHPAFGVWDLTKSLELK